MATPDFSKNTIDILAKRAAYKCSNPDCRANTIGPNSDSNKTTSLGEAAHIYGARIGSKRFKPEMNDSLRAEITNAIWLCRNCHKLIDTDDKKYSSNILFIWREKHEEFITSSLGSSTDKIIYNEQISILRDFYEYSPVIKRIIIDKPDGWEYRLTAELMRSLNEPLFRKLKDLKEGLYLKPLENIGSDKAYSWVQDRISELTRIAQPSVGLLDLLTKSWGKPGEPGDIKEIHHVTKLIKEYLEHVIAFEERIGFVNVPKEYDRIVQLLKNIVGSQVEKLSSIPSDLDQIISFIENPQNDNETPKIITKEIIFELPLNWEKEFTKELNKLNYKRLPNSNNCLGCLITSIFVIIIIALLI